MPGNLKNTKPNRIIQSDMKSHKIVWEEEKPIRWSYMKILREYSTLKEFYPELDPYVEVYRMRDNMWAIFQESMDGMGDVWMYLIDGPEKAMLIDNGFGIGDLKSVCKKLVGDKPILAAITHAHYDHCYGSAQFEDVYCYAPEAKYFKLKNNDKIWDYLYDKETGKGIYTEFDPKDIIPYKPYTIHGVEANHIFDLGQGYEVELIPLVGHTAGMCGYLDKQDRVLFCGDCTGIGMPMKEDPEGDNCTIEALHDCFEKIWARQDEFDGVFPGHGMLDQTKTMIKYHLYATQQILDDPDCADEIGSVERDGKVQVLCKKYIQQGTAMRYRKDQVYRSDTDSVQDR